MLHPRAELPSPVEHKGNFRWGFLEKLKYTPKHFDARNQKIPIAQFSKESSRALLVARTSLFG